MIVLSVAACGIYVAMSGLGVIGKTGTVLFVLFLFVTSILVISSLEDFTFVDFHLAERNVGKGIFHSAVSELARSSYLAVIVFLLPSTKGNAAKTSVYFLLTRLALVEIVLGFITMILGDYTLLAKLPFFALAAFSRTAIIERYDAAVIITPEPEPSLGKTYLRHLPEQWKYTPSLYTESITHTPITAAS